jgi:hypothetical protein
MHRMPYKELGGPLENGVHIHRDVRPGHTTYGLLFFDGELSGFSATPLVGRITNAEGTTNS